MDLYADAHVHIYRCFDLVRWLDAARARAAALPGPLLLLLTESAGYDYFAALRASAEGSPPRDAPRNLTAEVVRAFPVAATREPVSLRAGGVHLVAGRQLVSSEAIEVLALAADPAAGLGRIADGTLAARDLLGRVLAAGAVAVLPWGVGKWLGVRGRRVAALAADPELRGHPRFFMGDIAGRCRPWPAPAVFAATRVMPGSDILPVPGAEGRLAGYGFRVGGTLDPERPAASLLAALAAAGPIEPWGRREGALPTLLEQLRHRVRGGDA
jgi:hypothetical protein